MKSIHLYSIDKDYIKNKIVFNKDISYFAYQQFEHAIKTAEKIVINNIIFNNVVKIDINFDMANVTFFFTIVTILNHSSKLESTTNLQFDLQDYEENNLEVYILKHK